ncbi:MAG: Ig-like domain-containing protein, partial [Phormidesmis sp.]
MRHWWERVGYGVMGLAIALIFAACNPNNRSDDSSNADPTTSLPPLKPFPEVVEQPAQPLPDWIAQISPTDEADSLAQICIRFESPLIPLESLESPERAATLDRFELVPELPGEFRFLTPRMVGFQGDRALPKATRFQITLKAGLNDLENHELAEDLAWTFNTEPIELTDLPGLPSDSNLESAPIELEPTFELTANTALDVDSLKSHVKLMPAGQDRSVPVTVTLLENEPEDLTAGEQFEPPVQHYGITPRRSLKKATNYRLAIAPGIKPAQGNLASEPEWNRQIMTYAPLAFEGLPAEGEPGYGGAYGRFTNGLARLQFNNGLEAESVLEAIAVEPPPKEAPQLLRPYDGYNAVDLNPGALEPNTEYTFTIGAGLTDQFGQTLGEPVTAKYQTGDLSAELWAPSGLNIFPIDQDLQLNISAVNLPEGAYKAAFAPVQPTDLVYTDSAYPRDNNTDLLPDSSQWQSIAIKSEKNKVTESAIPLAQKLSGKTGMLAYGVQARTVQVEGEWQEPNFYGLVQLTNLGVFAQWFPAGGQVRVHHLSDGSPVRAAVEIYRSQLESLEGGTPEPCATGQTDNEGVLRLDAASLERCMLGASQFDEPPELLAVATENQDWAFVRTQPYSGSYGYGIYADWEGDEPQSRGTIFSDRQLYQPGETAWFTGVA